MEAITYDPITVRQIVIAMKATPERWILTTYNQHSPSNILLDSCYTRHGRLP